MVKRNNDMCVSIQVFLLSFALQPNTQIHKGFIWSEDVDLALISRSPNNHNSPRPGSLSHYSLPKILFDCLKASETERIVFSHACGERLKFSKISHSHH